MNLFVYNLLTVKHFSTVTKLGKTFLRHLELCWQSCDAECNFTSQKFSGVISNKVFILYVTYIYFYYLSRVQFLGKCKRWNMIIDSLIINLFSFFPMLSTLRYWIVCYISLCMILKYSDVFSASSSFHSIRKKTITLIADNANNAMKWLKLGLALNVFFHLHCWY